MRLIIRNFIRIFQRFKLAMTLNILGLSVAFTAFMIIMMQWRYDTGGMIRRSTRIRRMRIVFIGWMPRTCLVCAK